MIAKGACGGRCLAVVLLLIPFTWDSTRHSFGALPMGTALTGVALNGWTPKLTWASHDFRETWAKNVFPCNGAGISNAWPRSFPTLYKIWLI